MSAILGREQAVAPHRLFVAAALIVTGLAGTPMRAIAQTSMADDSTGLVLVSRREVRVVFPPESQAAWSWPEAPGVDDSPTFFWYAAFHGIEGRVRLGVSLHARDSVRTAPSLESIVRAAKVERCHLSRWAPCTERGVKANVQGRSVIIALRDSGLIARLFALRPDSVSIVSHMPRYMGDTRRSVARIQYVEPRLPDLDSAGRAQALEKQREYDRRELTLWRTLRGGSEADLLWLMVGDSAQLGIVEWQCRRDLCGHYNGFSGAPQDWGRWSVDDPRIARVHRFTDRSAFNPFLGHRDLVRTIVALRPGRTKVRAVGVHTFADSVASDPPLDSIIEREVLVTPPIGRLRISPRPATMVARDSTWFSVYVLDRAGRRIEGAPVDIFWGVTGRGYGSTAIKPVSIRFDDPGHYKIVAAVGSHADTLDVDVRPDARAP
jgi:hypothetical protein